MNIHHSKVSDIGMLKAYVTLQEKIYFHVKSQMFVVNKFYLYISFIFDRSKVYSNSIL